jgi:hypothetical protein
VKNCRRLTAAAALLAVLAVSQTLAVDVAVADGLDVVVHIESSTVTADRPAHTE